MRLSSVLFTSILAATGYGQEACDAACRTAFQAAVAGERASWVSKNLSAETFYSTPANSSGAKPGDVLRWENIPRKMMNTNFTAPGSMSISRFLYMTEDIDRKPIPASAFVLLPYNKPDPNKPFNTAVWAHGTAGRIRECAPSNHKDLYYEWQGPFSLAAAGYAVIAPDYSGQGSDIPQEFMYEAGYLHAADIAYGLIAARKVIGELLSDDYVVIGHSEGGMTAWRTNERLAMPDQEELLKAGTFLGSVADSPALRPLDLIPESIRRAAGGPIGDAVSVFFLQSLVRLFPTQLRIEDYVTDKVLGRLPLMDQGCISTGRALFAGLTKDELFKDLSWLTHPAVVGWQEKHNGAGPHALAAPMLVIAGLSDILTYPENTEVDFNRTCTSFPKSSVHLTKYPGVNHDLSPVSSGYEALKWIQDRFDHVEVEEGCSVETAQPVTMNFRDVGTVYSGSNAA